MRTTIIQKILITTGVFFLMNILLLLSLKSFHGSNNRQEIQLPIGKPLIRNPRQQHNLEDKSVPSLRKGDVLLPIVVFACNRPRALQNHINDLLKIRKNPELNPIILPDLGPLEVPPEDQLLTGYYRIARHYGYSLNHVLNSLNYEAIIITEDDLTVSPDFLDYFQALYPLLEYDQTIYCISAWNDNGINQKIERRADLLHRSDFFPSLGWLLTKKIWNEIKADWPKGFWDDWMRKPEQRRGRACIRPEVSRTGISVDGKIGVSGGQFYDGYLRKIIKNSDPVDWKNIDVSYLIKDRYDATFQSLVDSCSVITVSNLANLKSDMKCAQIRYSNEQEFVAIANALQIMNDFKVRVKGERSNSIVFKYRYT